MDVLAYIIFLAVLLAWIALVVHAVFFGWRNKGAVKSSIRQLLLVGPFVFIAAWVILLPLLGLLGWVLVWGDNGPGPTGWLRGIALGIAVSLAMLVTLRLARGFASPNYGKIQLGLSLTVLLGIGVGRTADYFGEIDGWSPEATAAGYLDGTFDEAPKLERVDSTVLGNSTKGSACFDVEVAGERRGFVSVRRRFPGWSISSNSIYGTAADDWKDLSERLGRMQHYRDPHNQAQSLNLFIQQHPDSPETDLARARLKPAQDKANVIDRAKELGGRVYLLRRLPQLRTPLQQIPVSGITPNQRTALLCFEFYETAKRIGIYGFYQNRAEYRVETAKALREIGAISAAEYLENAEPILAPFLDENDRIRPESRREASRLAHTSLSSVETHLPDTLNRLIIYCHDRSEEFPPKVMKKR